MYLLLKCHPNRVERPEWHQTSRDRANNELRQQLNRGLAFHLMDALGLQ